MPGNKIADLMSKLNLGCLVVDFSALRPHRNIVQQIIKSDAIKGRPVYQVDAHNIVPVTVTSEKQEYAARTIRNKVTGKLPEFLTSSYFLNAKYVTFVRYQVLPLILSQ